MLITNILKTNLCYTYAYNEVIKSRISLHNLLISVIARSNLCSNIAIRLSNHLILVYFSSTSFSIINVVVV